MEPSSTDRFRFVSPNHHSDMLIRISSTVLLGFLARSLVAQPPAQAPYCLWDGVANVRGPHRYMDRGDRCEGLYAKLAAEVGSLTLVGATRLRSIPDSAGSLTLAWAASPGDSVWLVSESTKPRIPFRMSSLRVGPTRGFDWSLELARSEGLTAASLATLAWSSRPVGGSVSRVYLPLTLTTPGAGKLTDSVALRLMSSVELTALSISAGLVERDGQVKQWLLHDRKLENAYTTRDQPIVVVVPRVPMASVLRVLISGRTITDAPVAAEFFIAGVDR